MVETNIKKLITLDETLNRIVKAQEMNSKDFYFLKLLLQVI